MMPSLHLAALAHALQAPYDGVPSVIGGVCIDSRVLQAGDLFVALRGQRTDGHKHVAAAASSGAVAALVEEPVHAPIPTLQVSSTLEALAEIGGRNRDAYAGELIAITGSCGKTSVKNLCQAIFERVAPTVATAGNYNNEIGVPLTLARLDARTHYGVIEMGATRRGDIAHLCSMARPRVSAVLNASEAHLDGFGSVADVADVKAEIYDQLGASGAGVLNLDQRWASLWKERIVASGARLVSFSVQGEADVTASEVEDRGFTGLAFRLTIDDQSRDVELALPGRHNLANALAAAALASACDIDIDHIVAGLCAARAEKGRVQVTTLDDGTVLVDDSYNANPASVRAAIDLLANSTGRRALVLGEMLELGADSAAYHREAGTCAAQSGIDGLVGVGSALKPAVEAFGAHGQWFPDRDALLPELDRLLASSDVILVKGSRGAAMDTVLDALRDRAGGTG